MTELIPLASALHEKVWPLVGHTAQEIEDENAFMNEQVPLLAPLLVETPVRILGCIWGIHPAEAEQWREGIRAALAEAAKLDATRDSIYRAFCSKVRSP